MRLENAKRFLYELPLQDPTNFDPHLGPFTNIDSAFYDSLQSCRILLDEIRIPNDKGIEIAQSIRNGTARLVSDGSFFPEHKAGSSAFILTAGRSKKNKFVGMN